ncbi:MAG: 50S ribosomal protein L29 [Patescibacteria group bacterium]
MKDNLKELKAKSATELNAILAEQRELLRELRFKDANKQLRNIRQIRVVKKKIANVLTILKQQTNDQGKQ